MASVAWEQAEVDAANATGKQPVVFVHGLWLLASSWRQWRDRFEEEGFATLAPGWPGDPPDVAAARANPDAFKGQKVGMVADHYAEVIRKLERKPVIIGHSFGGLLTQKLVGMGLSVAAAPIDPAPHKGVLPLPFSALRGSSAVLRNPLNYWRTVTLSFEQFRYGFANAVPDDEARALYDEYHIACPGPPLFQVAIRRSPPARPGSDALHLRREGPPRDVVDGQRGAQALEEAQQPADRDRRAARPRPFADPRPRVDRGRSDHPRLPEPQRHRAVLTRRGIRERP
jgi:pimeloyl-ACP methyl ester carboxylesterase